MMLGILIISFMAIILTAVYLIIDFRTECKQSLDKATMKAIDSINKR